MIARDLVTGLEVGQDRERALEVGQEVVRVERDLRLLWMGGHDCSSVTVLGCALVGAIHPCGKAVPALAAVHLPARAGRARLCNTGRLEARASRDADASNSQATRFSAPGRPWAAL